MQMLNPLNERAWAYPALECVHILGMACGVGTAAILNLSLLGIGLTQNKGARLWRDLKPWTLSGLALAIFAGLLLFSIDPSVYYNSPAFRLKMLVLVLAIGFYFTVVRKTVALEQPRVPRAVASISFLLWSLVPMGGILIGFVGVATYPVLLSVHIVALIFLGGMILVTDLRLLGLAMRGYSASDLMNRLRVPKQISFAVAAACGVLLLGARAGQYFGNPWSWIKIILLALIAVNSLLFRRAAYNQAQPGYRAKLAAGVSLLLWTGAVFAARGPATVKDVMHSMVDPSGDFLFESVQTISDEHGVREKAPRTDQEWDDVWKRAEILRESPDLLMGRRAARSRDLSKNPEVENQPEEIQQLMDANRADFNRRAQILQDAASVAQRAAKARDKAALLGALDGIDKACEGCHVRYWYPKDKRAVEAAKQDGLIP